MTLSENTYTPLKLKQVNQDLFEFFSPYIKCDADFYITISDSLYFRIEPHYGLIFNQHDVIGQSYIIDIEFSSEEPITLAIPQSLINLILGNYLDPLLPEHFESDFVCSILEMIFADFISTLKENTGIILHFKQQKNSNPNFQTQWRVYVNDDNTIYYPILMSGNKNIIKDLLDRIFASMSFKPTLKPLAEIKVISFLRRISLKHLYNLKLGEIIIVMTKRHPINEPLVFIGNKIVLHTVLKEMELHITQEPSLIYDVEELKMTIHDDDVNALPEVETDDYSEEESDDEGGELKTALNDYKVTVTFELNRLEVPVHILSQLSEGSVINLQKQITEDVFLTVSGRTIAVGEVVQVGRNFGVLIKEVF